MPSKARIQIGRSEPSISVMTDPTDTSNLQRMHDDEMRNRPPTVTLVVARRLGKVGALWERLLRCSFRLSHQSPRQSTNSRRFTRVIGMSLACESSCESVLVVPTLAGWLMRVLM